MQAAIARYVLGGQMPYAQGQVLLSNLANPSGITPISKTAPQPVAPKTSSPVASPTHTAPAQPAPTPTVPPPQPVGAGSASLPTNMGYITQAPAGPNSGVPFSPLNTTGDLYASTLNQQWATPFTPPTAADVAATPGYQFMLDQGKQAIERSAAAQGNLLTGGVMKDLNNYAQNFADQYYQQAYNNLLNQYQMNYDIFNQNQNNLFNRLSAISGTGQTSTSQLANAGANYANTAANIGMTGASNVGNQMNNAGAAMASGYIGSANALGGMAQSLGQLPLAGITLAQNQSLIDALSK